MSSQPDRRPPTGVAHAVCRATDIRRSLILGFPTLGYHERLADRKRRDDDHHIDVVTFGVDEPEAAEYWGGLSREDKLRHLAQCEDGDDAFHVAKLIDQGERLKQE